MKALKCGLFSFLCACLAYILMYHPHVMFTARDKPSDGTKMAADRKLHVSYAQRQDQQCASGDEAQNKSMVGKGRAGCRNSSATVTSSSTTLAPALKDDKSEQRLDAHAAEVREVVVPEKQYEGAESKEDKLDPRSLLSARTQFITRSKGSRKGIKKVRESAGDLSDDIGNSLLEDGGDECTLGCKGGCLCGDCEKIEDCENSAKEAVLKCEWDGEMCYEETDRARRKKLAKGAASKQSQEEGTVQMLKGGTAKGPALCTLHVTWMLAVVKMIDA